MAEPAPPGSGLPALYVNPYTRLARDLVAVLASIGLKLRELWRRNRQADLPRPGFWPRSAAPLFWPLVIGAVLVLVLAGWRAFPGAASRQALARPLPSEPFRASGPAVQPETEAAASSAGLGQEPFSSREEPSQPLAPDPFATSPLSRESRASDVGTTDQESSPGQMAEEPSRIGDPAAAPPASLFDDEDPDDLIAALQEDPAAGRLVLNLRPGYGELSPRKRQERAERWRARSELLGYQELELRNGKERLLGRSALVGSGMILLEPDATPDGSAHGPVAATLGPLPR